MMRANPMAGKRLSDQSGSGHGHDAALARHQNPASQNSGSRAWPPIIGSRHPASRPPVAPPRRALGAPWPGPPLARHGSYPGHGIKQPRPRAPPARAPQSCKPPRTRHRICL